MEYIGYYQSLDASGTVFSSDLEHLKKQWYFAAKIFEADGLTQEGLKLLFPDKPPMGTVLKYLVENKKEVWSDGNMVYEVK